MRLNPADPKDRKFMEDRIDPKTGKSLMQLHLEAGRKSAIEFNRQYNEINSNSSESATDKKKGNRYNNKRTFVDGQWFDSAFESKCWVELKSLQGFNIISNLSRDKEQCLFNFSHNGVHIAKAKFDFCFEVPELNNERFLADAKSPVTMKFQRFRWQKNMMLAFFNLRVITFVQGDDKVSDVILHLIKNNIQ